MTKPTTKQLPRLGTHSPKCRAPLAVTAAPVAAAVTAVPGTIGSHSLPLVGRLAAACNATDIPKAKSTVAALEAGRKCEATAVMKAAAAGETIFSPGTPGLDAHLPQVLLPGPDGEEISVTPLTAPKVLQAVIEAIVAAGEREENPLRVPRANSMAYVGKPQNLAGMARLRGPVFHAVPPARDEAFAARLKLKSDVFGWTKATLFDLTRQPWFKSCWELLAAGLKDSARPVRSQRWAQERLNKQRTAIVKAIELKLRECTDSTEEFHAQREAVLTAAAKLLARKSGPLTDHTKNWFIQIAS